MNDEFDYRVARIAKDERGELEIRKVHRRYEVVRQITPRYRHINSPPDIQILIKEYLKLKGAVE